jgi:uncharacterized membrane protein YiaA
MKRVPAGFVCQIAGIAVMVLGLWPVLRVYQKSQPDARLSYHDIAYSDYSTVLSVIILLVGFAVGIILLWLGSRIKSRGKKPV